MSFVRNWLRKVPVIRAILAARFCQRRSVLLCFHVSHSYRLRFDDSTKAAEVATVASSRVEPHGTNLRA